MSHDEESVLEADPLLAQTPAVSRMERLLYYLIWIWRICIFAVTGSSSMAVTRAILTRALQMESGTWYYYVVFFFLELVVYTIMLILIGTCLGQWKFFCNIGFRMWGWMFPQRICRCFNDKFKQSEEK